ncbi:hypothetical protein HGRIS_007015 [Hohenbuehelia grisea]|uniref:Transmembrane protein n=1 Tax=Hohenbuehelia grisea TaxID=104357 RepID=A0ABR3JAT1_9AGAR
MLSCFTRLLQAIRVVLKIRSTGLSQRLPISTGNLLALQDIHTASLTSEPPPASITAFSGRPATIPFRIREFLLGPRQGSSSGEESLVVSSPGEDGTRSYEPSVVSSTTTIVAGSSETLSVPEISRAMPRQPPASYGWFGMDSSSPPFYATQRHTYLPASGHPHSPNVHSRGRRRLYTLLAFLSVAAALGIVFWLSHDPRFQAHPHPAKPTYGADGGMATPEPIGSPDGPDWGSPQFPVSLSGILPTNTSSIAVSIQITTSSSAHITAASPAASSTTQWLSQGNDQGILQSPAPDSVPKSPAETLSSVELNGGINNSPLLIPFARKGFKGTRMVVRELFSPAPYTTESAIGLSQQPRAAQADGSTAGIEVIARKSFAKDLCNSSSKFCL